MKKLIILEAFVLIAGLVSSGIEYLISYKRFSFVQLLAWTLLWVTIVLNEIFREKLG
tara:strand:+ start:691 stop:861 length:171 start_codon:yes stop_codon:yes gene_type:complete